MFRDPDSGGPWVPRADVFTNPAGEFTIKVELAGLRRDDVELFLEERGIRITGCRPDADRAEAGSRFFESRIHWGWFDMVVEVPAGFDLNRARAQYQNGLLRVRVPAVKGD